MPFTVLTRQLNIALESWNSIIVDTFVLLRFAHHLVLLGRRRHDTDRGHHQPHGDHGERGKHDQEPQDGRVDEELPQEVTCAVKGNRAVIQRYTIEVGLVKRGGEAVIEEQAEALWVECRKP